MARAASAASVGGSAGSCQPSPSADLDTYEVVVTYSHWEAAVCSTSLTLEDMVACWEFGREVGLRLLRAMAAVWASFAKKATAAPVVCHLETAEFKRLTIDPSTHRTVAACVGNKLA